MVTKELYTNKMCLFCANEYHLEMILLPYIKEEINNSKFVILTENNLNKTVEVLLERVNFDDNVKDKILNLDWNSCNKDNLIKKYTEDGCKLNIIINGGYDYIKEQNEKLDNLICSEVNFINCFHIEDSKVNVEEISKKYGNILNTKKI